ncbi:MAG: UDP-3-O-(3-hydroxymyristoyl)glucosamine N-acyltransferase [Parachlamydiaceae bacterium]|nr:UDP-3-O-(3-hydroxymyristoyl)glucosamine N-acyltransferase [Parachlamydiaceae bacterium]
MNKKKQVTLNELALLTHSQLVGAGHYLISGVADLDMAGPNDASFFSNPRYSQSLLHTKAGVIFVSKDVEKQEGKNYLVSDQPSHAFQQLIDFLYPSRHPSGFKGIHSTAVIHETVQLDEGVSVGPHAVLDEGVIIGKDTFIGAGVYIGYDSTVGDNCLIHPGVIIREQCVIGNRVIVQPGAVIGSCGFGYITDQKGNHIKLNQVGNVEIHDDVEIGANTTIDRSRFKSTVVGLGTKIDNLVQLGHGVQLGEKNIIVAQSGLAGSTTTGKYFVCGGQSAVAGHLNIGDFVTVAGKSGVTKSLKAGKYGGIPAIPLNEYNRTQVFLRNIESYVKELKELKKKFESFIKDDSKSY